MKLLLASSLSKVKVPLPFSFEKPFATLKAICITTAVNPYPVEARAWHAEEMQVLRDLGIALDEYDIAGKTAVELEWKFDGADVFYVTGGNTYYLLEQMQKCDFKSVLLPVLEKGALYIGCSAGAVAACPAVDFIETMDDVTKANLTDFTGMGLVPFYLLPHIDHPKYGAQTRTIAASEKNRKRHMIGLRDSQFMTVTDGFIEVFG